MALLECGRRPVSGRARDADAVARAAGYCTKHCAMVMLADGDVSRTRARAAVGTTQPRYLPAWRTLVVAQVNRPPREAHAASKGDDQAPAFASTFPGSVATRGELARRIGSAAARGAPPVRNAALPACRQLLFQRDPLDAQFHVAALSRSFSRR